MYPKKLWINLPQEYCADMSDLYMEKYNRYRALANQLDEHKNFLLESSALFYFTAHAFKHYPTYADSPDILPRKLDELQRYMVKTDFVEFINACNFVICYTSESQILHDWGNINIRADLCLKYENIKGLLKVYGVEHVDIQNCDVNILQNLIGSAMDYLNKDGFGCYDIA